MHTEFYKIDFLKNGISFYPSSSIGKTERKLFVQLKKKKKEDIFTSSSESVKLSPR